ncbi:unnamed protein product [Meganyctiphanes norvegica]|uniref:Protein-tyrosine-phosphatase n=1 Tax=Meganyctiphanes norvegica TaxID=48144 RepID=A0AAV2QIW2_MEGNR
MVNLEAAVTSFCIEQSNGKALQKSNLCSEISSILPWLFLSGARAVREARLHELGITNVINTAMELPEQPLDNIEVTTVQLQDVPGADLSQYLHQICDKLESIRMNDGRALVHCVAGVSRSPSFVLAYLVKYGGMSLREAYQHVHDIRHSVRPNHGFFESLIAFEYIERGRSTVNMITNPDVGLTVPDVCENELHVLKDERWALSIKERRGFDNRYA